MKRDCDEGHCNELISNECIDCIIERCVFDKRSVCLSCRVMMESLVDIGTVEEI